MFLIAQLPDDSTVEADLPTGRAVTVGRGEGSDISIPDTAVSHVHFRIAVNGRNGWIEDMDSRNGTFVNGERVKDATITPGDLIVAGHCRILLGYSMGEAQLLEMEDEDEVA